MNEHLQLEMRDQIGILTINRPAALNALNETLLHDLLELLNTATEERKLRALILTGAGPKAFIAGADIKQMAAMDHLQMHRFCGLGQQVTLALEQAPFVTIAAVNGYALGGGLEMALACDFIYAAQGAKLGLPEVTLGIIPGFGGTQRLARAIGSRRAKEIMMTGQMLTADQALSLGVVNRVCSEGKLISESLETAQNILKNSAIAVAQIKRAVDGGYNMSLIEALELERNMCSVCFATPERLSHMEAFLKKSSK